MDVARFGPEPLADVVVPTLTGHMFGAGDTETCPVAVVNEAAARDHAGQAAPEGRFASRSHLRYNSRRVSSKLLSLRMLLYQDHRGPGPAVGVRARNTQGKR